MPNSTGVERTPPPEKIETEQIKHIYDYTKFHIGLYSTLLTGLIALTGFVKGKDFGQRYGRVLFVIIVVLLVGGIAGALAASRIVYGPWQDGSFCIKDSRFWKKRWFRPEKYGGPSWWSWADISLVLEHYAFWVALFIAIITLSLTETLVPEPVKWAIEFVVARL